MTTQEAIEFFKGELEGGKCSEHCVQCNANELALQALEKQIPQKAKNITITLYGGFFSPDMRCIINSIETQFIFGSENVVGCLLPSLRANVYNFTGYLRREDCEQTSDYSFNFTVYKSLSII